MIKSSIIRKFLIPKFSLIGKLRAALMLLHIITNNDIINLLKVEDIVRCKGNINKMLLFSIYSKYHLSTLNFWVISDLESYCQSSISRPNETIGHPSWFHRFRMVNWSLESLLLNQLLLVIICIPLIFYFNVKEFTFYLYF